MTTTGEGNSGERERRGVAGWVNKEGVGKGNDDEGPITHFQPHEPLLVGWIAGGKMTTTREMVRRRDGGEFPPSTPNSTQSGSIHYIYCICQSSVRDWS
jgi:hypothetical protein